MSAKMDSQHWITALGYVNAIAVETFATIVILTVLNLLAVLWFARLKLSSQPTRFLVLT